MEIDDIKDMAKNVGDKTADFVTTAGKKTGEVAKNLGEKTGDVIEIGKLNMKIKADKAKMKFKKEKLGDYYYKQYKSGKDADTDIDSAVKAVCEEIRELENNIAEAEMKIANVKNN